MNPNSNGQVPQSPISPQPEADPTSVPPETAKPDQFNNFPMPPSQPDVPGAAPLPEGSYAQQTPQNTPGQPLAQQEPVVANSIPQQQTIVDTPAQTAGQPIMPQTSLRTTPPQGAGDYYANGAKPGNTLGILSLVLAIILTPVGIVLGVVSIIKGFKHGNKALGIMGIGGVVLGLLSSLFWIIVLIAVIAGGNLSSTKSTTIKLANDTVTMNIPEKMKKTNDTSNDSVVYGVQASGGNGQGYSSQISVATTQSVANSSDLVLLKQILEDPTNEQRGSVVGSTKEPFYSLLERIGLSKSVIGDPQKITINGSQMAYRMTFEGEAQNQKYTGYLIFAISGSDAFDFLIGADKNIWAANKSTFDKIVTSINIQAQ